MIKIETNPVFKDCKRCSSCKENGEDIEFINIDNHIFRICKECRKAFIKLLKSID